MVNSSSSSSTSSVDKTSDVAAPTPSPSSSSFLDGWKERIFYPTILGGIVGGAVGAVSKHRQVHGLANISATYATNFAIVSGCYCGKSLIIVQSI
ncbi:Homeobox protein LUMINIDEPENDENS [Bienertia sinuspersici]